MADLNYYPVTSPNWVEQKMAIIEPLLRKQLTEISSARGLDVNDPLVQKQIENEIDRYRQQYMSEQSQYAFQEQENQKSRESQEKMAKEQAKSAENAALWSGLGQLGAYSLLTPKGTFQNSTLGSGFKSIFEKPTNINTNTSILPSSPNIISESNKYSPYFKSTVDDLTNWEAPKNFSLMDKSAMDIKSIEPQYSTWQRLGQTALSSLPGLVFNPGKGSLQSSLLGTGLSYFNNNYTPWSMLSTGLGSLIAPKEGLFSKGSNFWKSLASVGLNALPLFF